MHKHVHVRTFTLANCSLVVDAIHNVHVHCTCSTKMGWHLALTHIHDYIHVYYTNITIGLPVMCCVCVFWGHFGVWESWLAVKDFKLI